MEGGERQKLSADDDRNNVNVYANNLAGDGDEDGRAEEASPSKVKDNARLADIYARGKASNKPSVNLVINNTFEPAGYVVDDEASAEKDEEEEDMDPKTLVRREVDNRFEDDFTQ